MVSYNKMYRKKPVLVYAAQWFKLGDAPKLEEFHEDVTQYDLTSNPPHSACDQCDASLADHGSIKTREGQHRICPNDYVITGVEGDRYAIKPTIFEKCYSEY